MYASRERQGHGGEWAYMADNLGQIDPTMIMEIFVIL